MSSLLKLENVSYAYHSLDGEIPALTDISFQVEEGEFLAIVGPSGCGNPMGQQRKQKGSDCMKKGEKPEMVFHRMEGRLPDEVHRRISEFWVDVIVEKLMSCGQDKETVLKMLDRVLDENNSYE